MNTIISSIKVLDNPQSCLIIKSSSDLTSSNTKKIREAMEFCLSSEYPVIYLDTRLSKEADLAGINEIIHFHYMLSRSGKKLIFAYSLNSSVAKWVEVTGLGRFVEINGASQFTTLN